MMSVSTAYPADEKAELISMHHHSHSQPLACLFVFVGAIILLTTTTMRGDTTSEKTTKLNGGYYLLHQLSADEKQVPMLMVIKHVPSGLPPYADHIAKTAAETLTALDHMQQGDPSLRFDQNPLPMIEQDVRDSIKEDKQHQLLFGTTDAEFVRAFLISQIEACTYAENISKVLAQQETDPDRVKTLQRLSTEWFHMRNEAYRILRDY
jgi:hypothetical protein